MQSQNTYRRVFNLRELEILEVEKFLLVLFVTNGPIFSLATTNTTEIVDDFVT